MRNRTNMCFTFVCMAFSIFANGVAIAELYKKSKICGGFKELIKYNWNS